MRIIKKFFQSVKKFFVSLADDYRYVRKLGNLRVMPKSFVNRTTVKVLQYKDILCRFFALFFLAFTLYSLFCFNLFFVCVFLFSVLFFCVLRLFCFRLNFIYWLFLFFVGVVFTFLNLVKFSFIALGVS